MPQSYINNIATRLQAKFSISESRVLARELLCHVLNVSSKMLYVLEHFELTEKELNLLDGFVVRLMNDEPIQYITNSATFYSRDYYVDNRVLIPRPETEELVDWIVKDNRRVLGGAGKEILDIGTGSACIAISLANELLGCSVTAYDISLDALQVAEKNAITFGAGVNFVQQDIFKAVPVPNSFHVIVSNPPYIMECERVDMENNVLRYEPDLALFVPNDDALKFYRVIAEYASVALKEGGVLYFEINRACGEEMVYMLEEMGYRDVELRVDMGGDARMIKAGRR